MDSKKKLRRPVASSSSSSSEDSSFSSSSGDARKKQKRRAAYSSSSSEEEKVRKSHKHKKSAVRKHSHSAKLREKMTHGKKARSMSPATKAAHKHKLKLKKAKYAAQEIDHERRSRSPTRRNVKKDRTPEHKIASPTTRIRVSIQNNRAIQERPSARIRKEPSPISIRRRDQAAAEKERLELSRQEALKESERLKRAQQEEEQRYKRLKKHHHEHSPSPVRGKISIHDRLDGGYNNPRRSISRDITERDDYMMRDNFDRNPEPERNNYEYRERDDERDRRYEFSTSNSRPPYDDQPPSQQQQQQRHHRHHYNEPEPREPEPRGRGGVYESRRRFPDDNPAPYESNSGSNFDKWPKDEVPPMRSSWKDSGPSNIHSRGPPPKRFPYSSHSSSGPSGSSPHGGFKPRFSGSSPHFQKRFPFQPRYPNQYSKINYSKRNVPPSATETLSSTQQAHSSSSMLHVNEPIKHEIESPHMLQQSQLLQPIQQPQSAQPIAAVEPMEIKSEIIEHEEVKVEADTTTMSGNVDTQSQEECEGNLSEFSDVDDEILNREEIEESSSGSYRMRKPTSAHELINAIKKEQAEQEDQADEKEQKIISKIHANNELKREMDLDFEEISDGEFEEESRLKTIGDALGVDWESLAKETQKPLNRVDAENSTTKSRLTPHRIIWDIGVSAKILGEEKARQILTAARDKLRAEKAEADALKVKTEPIKTEPNVNGDVKLEPKEENGDVENGIAEKVEVKTETVAKVEEDPKPTEIEHDFELDDDVLPHPLASIQVLTRQLKMQRRNLILNSSCRYGRALSARKDIQIRRELCRLPSRDIKIDRSCAPSEEVRKSLNEIYKRVLDSVAA